VLEKSLHILASKILTMSSNEQLGGQPSRGRSDQNPLNKLSHTSFSSYPPRPLSDPPSIMHKQKATKISIRKNISPTQSQKRQMFEDNDLKRITTWQVQEIVMTFFMEHTMTYFDNVFVSKQRIGLGSKQVMENKFLVELDDSPQYTKLWKSKRFSEWFEWKFLDAAKNLLQWFDVLYPQMDKAH
jgi:hypothetical protein